MKIAAPQPRWFPSRPRPRVRRRPGGAIARALQALEGRRLLSTVPALIVPLSTSASVPVSPASSPDPSGATGPGPVPSLPHGGPIAPGYAGAPLIVSPWSTADQPRPYLADFGSGSPPEGDAATIPTSEGPPPIDRQGLAAATVTLDGTPTPELAVANAAAGRVTVYEGGNVVFTANGLGASTAVKLADLDDDGTPDLIIADATNNRVLIYAGLAQGGFGAEVAGGRGFQVGIDPVGLTVGRLDGAGRPSLLVANKGSDDVSILQFAGSGANWSVASRATVEAGIAPVKTVLVDPGDGSTTPNLLICNSGSADIYAYKTTASGQVATVAPAQIIPVDKAPSDMYAGHFGRHQDVDVVTVSDDSDRATFVGGVFTQHPFRQDVVTGIMHPIAALALTVGAGGSDDLMVAGSDGRIALLQGTEDGLQLTNLSAPTGLSTVNAIATGDYSDGGVNIYEASGESDIVAIVRFNLGELAPFVATPTPEVAATIRSGDEATAVELISAGPLTVRDRRHPLGCPGRRHSRRRARSYHRRGRLAREETRRGPANPTRVPSWRRADRARMTPRSRPTTPSPGRGSSWASTPRSIRSTATLPPSPPPMPAPPTSTSTRSSKGERPVASWPRPPSVPPSRTPTTDPVGPGPSASTCPGRTTGPRDRVAHPADPAATWRAAADRDSSAGDTPGLLTAVAGSGVAVRFLVNLSPPRPPRPEPRGHTRTRPGRLPVPAWPEIFPPTSPLG